MSIQAEPARWRRVLGQWPWVAPAVVCALGALVPPPAVARLDDQATDVLRRGAATVAPDPRVVIVDVDERSLAAVGQWPWRRDRLGSLIERIRAGGARVIALDAVFSEPDRTATPDADSDAAFATTLRGGGVILGYAMTFGDAGRGTGCELHPLPVTLVQPSGTTDVWPMFEATGAVCSLPALASAAGASGFLNATPDGDGILRRAPLAIHLHGAVYPSLGLAAALAVPPRGVVSLRAVNANASRLGVGERQVPLDGRANLLLRFRGRSRTFPFVPAADVLNDAAAPGAFRDKVVFVGATALGAQELVATPLDPRFIGVEVQATVADNVLQGDFLSRPADAPLIEAILALAFAAVVALAARAGLWWVPVAAVGSLAALWTGAWWLFGRWGVVLSPVIPSASVVVSAAGIGVAVAVRLARAATADATRARADAEAAAQAYQAFLSSVSRELRAPLAAIQGYARMVGKGELGDDAKVQALAAVERHAAAQTRVIQDLVDASRAAGGRLRLTLEAVDLAALVRSVVAMVGPAIDGKRLTVDVSVAGDLGSVWGDPERLRQVAFHLLSNAVKFTAEGGQVTVGLTRDHGDVELTVRDNGIGIAAPLLPQIFTTYPAGAREGGSRGLGLGLSLVRHIVELHGGSVSADSDGPGCGATFRVRLPLTNRAPVEALRTSDTPRLDGVRVLLVDPQAEERGRMASALLRAGAVVVTAASSEEALALMRDDSRDVLVVTMGAGSRNGYWLAREALAAALNRGEHLAVVAVTPSGDDRGRGHEIGIERYLTAPVEPADLVRVIAGTIRTRSPLKGAY